MESTQSNRKRLQITKRATISGLSIKRISFRKNIRAHCRHRKIQKAIKKVQKEKTGISKFGLLKFLQYAANFIGVFAEDQLKNIALMSFPSFLVINLDPSYLSGSHWLAVRISHTSIEIFDPLGFDIFNWPRIPCNLLNFLFRWSKHRKRFISPLIQSKTSLLCGYYCIAFVLCRNIISFNEFMNIFKSPKQNDNLLLNVFL